MTKNKLTDLNDHLFMQLERLAEESLTPEELEREVARSQAIVGVADQVIRNADLHLRVAKLMADEGGGAWVKPLLPMIEGKEK